MRERLKNHEYIFSTDDMYAVDMRRFDELTELIRCKDCKWFGNIGCAISIVDDTDKPSENDYCSFAERKE